jgi:hypothetical protein
MKPDVARYACGCQKQRSKRYHQSNHQPTHKATTQEYQRLAGCPAGFSQSDF